MKSLSDFVLKRLISGDLCTGVSGLYCAANHVKFVSRNAGAPAEKARPVGVWGACFDQGQPHRGVGDAPSLMRKAGLTSRLKSLGCDLTDHGDISVIRDRNVDTMEERKMQSFRFARQAQERVQEILDQGQVCLTLGGDHSIGMGTVAGHLAKHPDAVVLWVDAHADINTFNTSTSGNVHGMSLSFNIPQLQDNGLGGAADWLSPALQPERLAYIGLRDVDEGEKQILADLGIASFYIEDVDRLGIVKTVEEALLALDHTQTRPIHMSFDIDVLDPSEAPATGTRVRGGLSLKEGLTLCEMVHSTGRLQAVDLVEVNPEIANNQEEIDRTVRAANNIVLASLGYRASPPMELYF